MIEKRVSTKKESPRAGVYIRSEQPDYAYSI